MHLEVRPASCHPLHPDTGAPFHEERVIAIREEPNLHLELHLRLRCNEFNEKLLPSGSTQHVCE